MSARSSKSDLEPYGDDELHTVLSGTSMSTPHISGSLAIIMSYLLWSGKFEWNVRELYELLKNSSRQVKQSKEIPYA